MKQTCYLLLVLVSFLCLAACSDSIPLPTSDQGEIKSAISSPTTTQTQIPEPSSTATSPPSIDETSRILWVSASADLFNRVMAVDPHNQERLAFCAQDEIHISDDAGKTWDTIPTSGVISLVEEKGYSLFGGDPSSVSTCLSVAIDPEHPNTIYSVFTAAKTDVGAPPVLYMGFFTPDKGDTWEFVPPPVNSTLEEFAGFWNLGREGVEAVFNLSGQSEDPIQNILVVETFDGGVSWQSGELSCPKSGPCTRWGPAPSSIPGMGSPLPQEILSSSDGGSTWERIEPPVELRAPAPNQLVAFSDQEIAIISGSIALSGPVSNTSALRISQDTGFNFQQIELPTIALGAEVLNYFPGLQILPDESFLTQDPETNSWFWFDPNFPIWCPVNSNMLPQIPQLLQSSSGQLWWINVEENEAESIAISELGCADS
jgi:hypothetical protein